MILWQKQITISVTENLWKNLTDDDCEQIFEGLDTVDFNDIIVKKLEELGYDLDSGFIVWDEY